ncbi:capsular polysaccharide export protein, LipB/KpsS family [Pantoea agglomerans]|uniref:capsular polysaccharide export protein, LipB/KpsS family n=1 Tax=Enterobacter agglomerans TaxID=549 RepID=UPI003DA08036
MNLSDKVERSMPSKIVVEVPVSWTKNPVDGYKHKSFITNLILALTERKIPLYFREVPFGADEAPRKPEKGTLVFSYHSWGDEKNVVRMKEAAITPLFSFDFRGYSGWSDISLNFDKYKSQINRLDESDVESILNDWKLKFIEKNESKYPQSDEELPDIAHDFVFYPMQVQNDPVAIHSEYDGVRLLLEAAELAKENKVYLFVKRHPFCQSFAVEETITLLTQSNPWVVRTNSNIHTLIRKSKSVITINSGVGIEALIDGASVFCAGKCEWEQCCNIIKDRNDLKKAFLDDPEKMNSSQRKLLAFLLTYYWIDPKSPSDFDDAIDNVLANFDSEYGEMESHLNQSDVLLPIILDLHGRLEYEQRKAKQSTLDAYAAIDLYENLKKEKDSIVSELQRYIERVRICEEELEQLRNRI